MRHKQLVCLLRSRTPFSPPIARFQLAAAPLSWIESSAHRYEYSVLQLKEDGDVEWGCCTSEGRSNLNCCNAKYREHHRMDASTAKHWSGHGEYIFSLLNTPITLLCFVNE